MSEFKKYLILTFNNNFNYVTISINHNCEFKQLRLLKVKKINFIL